MGKKGTEEWEGEGGEGEGGGGSMIVRPQEGKDERKYIRTGMIMFTCFVR